MLEFKFGGSVIAVIADDLPRNMPVLLLNMGTRSGR